MNERKGIQWKLYYNTIILKEWALKIVNIANTGYYAPIIEIYKYEKGSEANFHTLATSILYEPFVKDMME